MVTREWVERISEHGVIILEQISPYERVCMTADDFLKKYEGQPLDFNTLTNNLPPESAQRRFWERMIGEHDVQQ